MPDLFTERSCHFSPCRTYRYMLKIVWNSNLKPQMFIGLNPSTADEENDDPTVRRCIDYAMRWGAGGLVMANACAYRATDPMVMLALGQEAIGPENNLDYLERLAASCHGKPIAAWGKHANQINRLATIKYGDWLKRFFRPLDCLRLNGDGSPCHPLYLPASLTPIPFNYSPLLAQAEARA